MGARKPYNKLLRAHIAPLLAERGFEGKNEIYRVEKSNTVGIIGFQKSVDSTEDQIKFTANVGIMSKRILLFEEGEYDIKKLEPEEGQWNKRIGRFLSDSQDKWWYVDEVTDISSLSFELISLIDQCVLPEMTKLMDEERLLELWANGQCMGITEFQRLEYLCVLAKYYRKEELFEKAKKDIHEFSMGKPIASSVAVFLRQIENFETN